MDEPERIVDLKERLGYLEDLHPAVQLAKMAKELAWQAGIPFNPDNLAFCASPSEDGRGVDLWLGYPTGPEKCLTSGRFIFDERGLGFCTGDGSHEQLSIAVEFFLGRIKY